MKRKIVIGSIVAIVLVIIGLVSMTVLIQSESVEEKIALANKYLSEGDYEEAILKFQEVIEIDEANVDVRLSLAEAYVAIGKENKAENVLEDILEIDDSVEEAYVKLAELYVLDGKKSKAIEIMEEGIKKTGNNDLSKVIESYGPKKPQVNLESGIYQEVIEVELSAEGEGKIFYTLDGSLPTLDSNEYTESIKISEDAQLKAIYVDTSFTTSSIAEFNYVMDIDADNKPQDETEPSKVMEEFEQKDYDFLVRSSSTLLENVAGESRIYSVNNMFDNNTTTIWAEGADDDGTNSWIEFSSDQAFDLESISITNGFTKNSDVYYKNNRFLEATISTNTGDSVTIISTDGDLNLTNYPVGIKGVSSFKIRFTKVIEGSKYNDLCISEIRINDQILEQVTPQDSIVDTRSGIDTKAGVDQIVAGIDRAAIEGNKFLATNGFNEWGQGVTYDYYYSGDKICMIHIGEDLFDQYVFYNKQGSPIKYTSMSAAPSASAFHIYEDKVILGYDSGIMEDPTSEEVTTYWFDGFEYEPDVNFFKELYKGTPFIDYSDGTYNKIQEYN